VEVLQPPLVPLLHRPVETRYAVVVAALVGYASAGVLQHVHDVLDGELLARARPGEHEQRTPRMLDGPELVGVEAGICRDHAPSPQDARSRTEAWISEYSGRFSSIVTSFLARPSLESR
jgi:hypothetical protein